MGNWHLNGRMRESSLVAEIDARLPKQLDSKPASIAPSYISKDENNHNETKTDLLIGHILPLYELHTALVSKGIGSRSVALEGNSHNAGEREELQEQEHENSESEDLDDFIDLVLPDYDEASTIQVPLLTDISLPEENSGDSNIPRIDVLNRTYSELIHTNSRFHDDTVVNWQDTILSGVHKINNIDVPEIQMELKFTREVGLLGVKPDFVSPLKSEFKQGDLVNGYITFRNTGTDVIHFDQFYVTFEGYFRTTSAKTGEEKIHKFLEMFDFSASWHYGYIYQLKSENPENQNPISVDPLDDSYMYFQGGKVIKPNINYKRFFTFRIPEKLLDHTCKHNLLRHTSLPPSMGFLNKNSSNLKTTDIKFNDFLFYDTTISYNVSARFLDKENSKNSEPMKSEVSSKGTLLKGKKFAILKEATTNLRIVESSKKYTSIERKAINQLSKSLFCNFLSRADEYIDLGKTILSQVTNLETNELEPLNSNGVDIHEQQNLVPETEPESTAPCLPISNELIKNKQMYSLSSIRYKKYGFETNEDSYKVLIPIKKGMLGASKIVGSLLVATPKTIYTIKYLPPLVYWDSGYVVDDDNWTVKIPINLEFNQLLDFKLASGIKLPELKSISADLMVLTLRTDGEPFPLDVSYEMMFDDIRSELKAKANDIVKRDKLECKIFKPARNRTVQLNSLSKKLGKEQFKVDADIAEDLKCVNSTYCKRNSIQIRKVETCKNGEWRPNDINPSNNYSRSFIKSLEVAVDLKTSYFKHFEDKRLKAYEIFCLVPTFQLCNMARYYYINLTLTFQKGEVMTIQAPLEIEK